jgi:hypothetical protein
MSRSMAVVLGMVLLVVLFFYSINEEPRIDRLDSLISHVELLERNVSELNKTIDELTDQHPEVMVEWLTRDLDLLERGQEPSGSFSDSFVATIVRIKEAGGYDEDINALLDRLIYLAGEGKYYNLQHQEMTEGVGDNGGNFEKFEGFINSFRP